MPCALKVSISEASYPSSLNFLGMLAEPGAVALVGQASLGHVNRRWPAI